MENLERVKKNKNKLLITFFILCAILAVYIYNSNYYVVVRFNELGPLTKNMPAYYNNFKVGKIVDIGPDMDYKHVLVKLKLYSSKLNLPRNSVVYVEKFPSGELYLKFEYPSSPSLIMMKRGTVLQGVTHADIEDFMLGQSISGMSDVVSVHVIKVLNATELSNYEMQTFFKNASNLVMDNRESIKTSVKSIESMAKSLSEMADNLNQVSNKLNKSIDEKGLMDTTSNIRKTADNIAIATKDLDKTVWQVNETAKSLNEIAFGIKDTLSKRFAGLRIMFGKPVDESSQCRYACK